jgi:hypothetical protein
MTPEGKVKNDIRRVLDAFGCYTFMPVQNGLGAAGLDFHCIVRGNPIPFFIEAKGPKGAVTDRQRMLIDKLRTEHGCKVFVIHDGLTLQELVGWLEQFEDKHEHSHAAVANL